MNIGRAGCSGSERHKAARRRKSQTETVLSTWKRRLISANTNARKYGLKSLHHTGTSHCATRGNMDGTKRSFVCLVIVRFIWQKLSSVERKQMLIVTHIWQLFSQIIGETLLIVTHIWPNHTCSSIVSVACVVLHDQHFLTSLTQMR
jgi:hypothetical protein